MNAKDVLTSIQGYWIQDPGRRVDDLFGIDLVSEAVDAGLLHSTDGTTRSTSSWVFVTDN